MSLVDNLYLSATFFGIAIFFAVTLIFWNAVTTPEMDAEIWDQSSIGASIKADGDRAYDGLDFMFIIVFFGMHLGIIVLAFMLRSHPAIYVAGIFVIAILCIISAPLANAWEDITQETDFATAITDLSMTNYIMLKLPIFEVVFGFLTLIVLAGIARSENLI